MWTPATRAQHARVSQRYQTDLSDAEWALISAFMPEARATGRRREWPMREIVNAIFYVLRGGIAWRLLPKDFPPWQTVYRWFARFRDESVFERINHALVALECQRAGRDASPSAAIIETKYGEATARASRPPRAAGRAAMMQARRSRVASAMLWSILTAGRFSSSRTPPVSRADVQDRDGGGALLRTGKTPSGKEAAGHIRRQVRHLRRHWPDAHITIRSDGPYGRHEVMAHVDYVFGLPTNAALRADPVIVTAADACAVRRAECQHLVLRGSAETRYTMSRPARLNASRPASPPGHQ